MKSKVRAVPVLQASDLERARRFYVDELGFSVGEEGPDGVMLLIGDSPVYLYQTSASPGESTVLSLLVEDFDREVEELRKHVTFEDYDLPNLKTENGIADMDGMHAAWFRDPEGNVININSWQDVGSLSVKSKAA